MTEALWIAGFAAVTVLVLLAMRAGWRGRTERSAAVLPALPEVPAGSGAEPSSDAVEATYVSTTLRGDWLARVNAHDLGVRSPAHVEVRADGVLVRRRGAQDLFVPLDALDAVGTSPGMAGKFVGGEGLLVLGWHVDDVALDTGLRTRHRADTARLAAAVTDLLDAHRTGVDAGTPRPTTEEDQR